MFSLEALGRQIELAEDADCSICHGLFLKLPQLAETVKSDLTGYEFSKFLVGSELSGDLAARDQEILGWFESAESIKKEFNREFGKLVSERLAKGVDLSEPDVIITVDLRFLSIRYWFKSLYLTGRYRKLVRGIPQTRWIHAQDSLSVEEEIGLVAKDLSDGKNFFLHGAGREDVDVRMLGNGREFVMEITDPKRRSIDLKALQARVNSSGTVEISDLAFADKSAVSRVKLTAFDKTYRVVIRAEVEMSRSLLEKAVSELSGKVIYQRTPLRVSRRRADTIRKKSVLKVDIVDLQGNLATVDMRTQAGTYVKELITGDEGRTKPSLSELYGLPLSVKELDVTGICTEET